MNLYILTSNKIPCSEPMLKKFLKPIAKSWNKDFPEDKN